MALNFLSSTYISVKTKIEIGCACLAEQRNILENIILSVTLGSRTRFWNPTCHVRPSGNILLPFRYELLHWTLLWTWHLARVSWMEIEEESAWWGKAWSQLHTRFWILRVFFRIIRVNRRYQVGTCNSYVQHEGQMKHFHLLLALVE